jgi:hypothetical protein
VSEKSSTIFIHQRSGYLRSQYSAPEDDSMVPIGLNNKQIEQLSLGITGLVGTESVEEVAEWQQSPHLTYRDNFPTTNIEALACGTPVITYNTGGSPEAIDEDTGIIVDKGDISGIEHAIYNLGLKDQNHLSLKCRERAEKYFDKNERYTEYLTLYQKVINK